MGSDETIAAKLEENVKIPHNQLKYPSNINVTYDEEKLELAKQEALARFNL